MGDPLSTFKSYLATSALIGYLCGLLYGGFEGIRTIVTTQVGPSSKTVRSFKDLIAVLGAPVAAYPIPAIMGALLLVAVSYPLWRKRARRLDEAGRASVLVGIIGCAGLASWMIFNVNPFFTKSMLFTPSRILINVQQVGLALLAGVGIALLAYALCKRYSPRAIALSLGAVWPALMIAGIVLFWTKRNLTFWRTPTMGALALGGITLMFLAMLVLFRIMLSRLYRPGAGWLRIVGLPVFLMVFSIIAVTNDLNPKIPTLSGGESNKGIKVILLTIDTLRADHLGCYGYERQTSPAMDSLAAEGVLFESARAQSPWTLSSLASLLTSTYPTVNSVMTGNNRLEEARTTIAEAMQESEVVTQAIVSNGWLQDNFGLSQGYSGYHHSADVFNLSRFNRMIWMRIAKKLRPDMFQLGRNALASGLVDRAVEWLGEYSDRDFFLWIHCIDPHDPYQPPPKYRGMFQDEPYEGRYKLSSGLIHGLRTGTRLESTEKAHIERLYDQEIRYADDNIARLIGTLRKLDIYDETLLLISSDHGEEFWEHDGLMHGHTLYEDQLHVPLIFRCPDRLPTGIAVDEPVRLLDVMPTILDLFSLPKPVEVQGTSLLPLLPGQNTAWAPLPTYAEALLYFDELKSISIGKDKLVLNPSTGKISLFDLSEDPAERWDLASQDSATVTVLETQLRRWLDDSSRLAEALPHSVGGSKAKIDPDTEAQLRALGYLN